MSGNTIDDFTIGHWRQAIQSFSILYPKDKFDWSEHSLVDDLTRREYATTRPHAFVGRGETRNLIITQAPLNPEHDADQITSLSAISVYYRSAAGRAAVVQTWVSKEEHQSMDGTIDTDRLLDTAALSEVAILDIDMPRLPAFDSAPAKTPVIQLFEQAGMPNLDSEQTVINIRRAAAIITSLSTDYTNIRELFPLD